MNDQMGSPGGSDQDFIPPGQDPRTDDFDSSQDPRMTKEFLEDFYRKATSNSQPSHHQFASWQYHVSYILPFARNPRIFTCLSWPLFYSINFFLGQLPGSPVWMVSPASSTRCLWFPGLPGTTLSGTSFLPGYASPSPSSTDRPGGALLTPPSCRWR